MKSMTSRSCLVNTQVGICPKVPPYGIVARHNAQLVARGFTLAYDIDYIETFSLVIRINSGQSRFVS